MTEQPGADSDAGQRRRALLWQIAWVIIAAAYAVPIVYLTNDRILEVTYKARERLILRHQLWELHPEYSGTPKTWTRFAARLLTDNQILRRVRVRYGELAREIELDYRRDLSIEQAEVVLVAAAAWGIPVGALYVLGLLALRRRPQAAPARQPEKRAVLDSRYRR